MLAIDIIEILMNFGLTRQEAVIYKLLFSDGELNGYEVSKLTGISRSNAYNALAGLVEKGAAYVIEGNAAIYTPVDIEEFCENKIRFMNKSKLELIKNIPKRKEKCDGYITIKDEKHIVDKMKNMLIKAKERVYISLSQNLLEVVITSLEEVRKKGIKLVIITDKNFNFEGATIYTSEKEPTQVRLIVDSKHVLTGDIKDTCLYSSNNNLVKVFKEALTNEIKLIELNKKER